MVQGIRSEKQGGALVGLHYHRYQADYWYLLAVAPRVVLHDLRVGSKTEGATEVIELDEAVDQGVYIPPGVAHGFAALTDILLTYLVDNYYDPEDELGLAWDDPAVGADWASATPSFGATRTTRDGTTSPTTSAPPGRLSSTRRASLVARALEQVPPESDPRFNGPVESC